MESLIAVALAPVALVGMMLRSPAGRRAAPYVLLALGGVLSYLNYPEQGERLLVSSLVLAAGVMWCMKRHGY